MPGTKHFNHRGAMIHLSSQVLQEESRPRNDGYRTPTIEDPEHPAHSTRNSWHQTGSLRTAPQTIHSSQHGLGVSSSRTPEANLQVLDEHSDESGFNPDPKPMVLSWSKRMKHVTWAYFTLTMATGGIANVLSRGEYILESEKQY
jgi:hypothetical protein